MTSSDLLREVRKAIKDEVLFLTRDEPARTRGLNLLEEVDKALKGEETDETDDKGSRLLDFLREHATARPSNGWLTLLQIDSALAGGVKSSELKKLVAAGEVEKQGQARGTRYRAKGGGA